MAGKYVVDHQACDSSVAVLEGVDSDVAVVEEGGEFYWREFAAFLQTITIIRILPIEARISFRTRLLTDSLLTRSTTSRLV